MLVSRLLSSRFQLPLKLHILGFWRRQGTSCSFSKSQSTLFFLVSIRVISFYYQILLQQENKISKNLRKCNCVFASSGKRSVQISFDRSNLKLVAENWWFHYQQVNNQVRMVMMRLMTMRLMIMAIIRCKNEVLWRSKNWKRPQKDARGYQMILKDAKWY